MFAFSVAPNGSGESVSEAVADAVAIVRASGLPNRTDSMFTTIEGEWDECMDVIKRACEAVGKHGNRVSLVLKADIRSGYSGEMTAKVERLEAALKSHDTSHGQDGPAAGDPPVATD
ncbi:MTH1187 family thiamine-binding protein [Kineosporia succinea]